jgi:predicted alpha/beta superfamily hydrolase
VADKNRNKTSGHSEAFINFLQQELQPFIQARYNGSSNSNTIIGQSLGGLLATEILLKRPTLFQQYIIISPSIWWDNTSLLQLSSPILEASFTQPTSVYIGVGKEGLAPTAVPHVMEVEANLLVEKLKASKSPQLTVHFDYLPQEDHATITHQAAFNALRLLHPVKGK